MKISGLGTMLFFVQPNLSMFHNLIYFCKSSGKFVPHSENYSVQMLWK